MLENINKELEKGKERLKEQATADALNDLHLKTYDIKAYKKKLEKSFGMKERMFLRSMGAGHIIDEMIQCARDAYIEAANGQMDKHKDN